MAKDPICGMKVDIRTPAATSDYKGNTYYFCTHDCKNEFDMNPDKYIGKNKSESGKKNNINI